MYEIRESVARQHGAVQNAPASNRNDGALALQPEFEPRLDNQYHVNDLLRFHGAEFVRNSYRALLLRDPDEIGMARHVEGLASGRFNKIDVLASLHSSREGRESNVKLSGLSTRSAVRRLGRVPLVGYLFRLMTAVARLPLTLKHQNQFEFYLSGQLQRIVDYQNQFQRDSKDQLAQISAQILEGSQRATEQQQSIEALLQHYERLFAQQAQLGKVIEDGLAKSREFDESTTKLISQVVQQQETIIQRQDDLSSLRSDLQTLALRQQKTSGEMRTQEQRVAVLLEQITRNAPASNDSFAQVARQEEEHLLDALYAAFEDQFRGDTDEVRRRLEVYIPFLKGAEISDDVLDVGCGRGEWLQLLNSEGIECQGVDRNRIFVEQCRHLGLNVVEADALEYLRSLSSSSLNCVSSFHLVEHLPFAELIKLLDEIFRILRPGGLVILETPNPENFIVGSCNFYTDPTHRNPIPNQTLQFLLESRGFDSINVLKLRPWDEAKLEGDSEIVRRFNEFFYSAPDYGVIATKPDSSV
jgi:O-antigen chain-terminating methyltransferase